MFDEKLRWKPVVKVEVLDAKLGLKPIVKLEKLDFKDKKLFTCEPIVKLTRLTLPGKLNLHSSGSAALPKNRAFCVMF